MTWWNPLSWGSSVQKDVFDKDNGLLTQVGSWIGAMSLTPEEVLEQNAKTVNSVQTYAIATLSESTDRSKTRRSIACMWIKSNLAIVFFACIAAPFDLLIAKFYLELATSGLMVSVTTAITIFFYGSHGIARIAESKKSTN